jgi:N-acyl-phosphatidylethanolamine-hydrolysing phospholipase D
MEARHVDPGEALQAFQDLGAAIMVPVHYDTFVNSPDRPGEVGAALRRAMTEREVDPKRVAILQIGEQRVIVASDTQR